MKTTARRLETDLIHAGERRPLVLGAVTLPIFQSSTYEVEGDGLGEDGVKYIRLNNTPNHEALHAKLAAIEGAEDALVAASGMAAISTALLAFLSAGDHLLVQDCLYGGAHDFVTKDLPALGIAHTFVDPDRPETWEKALRPNTKAFYVETLSNPLLGLGDLEAVAAFARKRGLVSMIDNTFASPVNFRPTEHGFALSLHSGTKYLNGHSDIVCGAVIGRREAVRRVKRRLEHLGGTLDPHAGFLLHRGLKTLALRVERHNENALALARFLEGHSAVGRVYYPGLRSHSRHARAKRLLDGFGGMLSFEPKGGLAAAKRLIQRLKLPISAPSLGGVESLITRPATTSHRGMTAEERRNRGISDALVRVSVGIEAASDLIADFRAALGAAALVVLAGAPRASAAPAAAVVPPIASSAAAYATFAALHARLMAGQSAADLEDAVPGLARNLKTAAEVSARYWTDSTPFDVEAKRDILPEKVLAGLGIRREVTAGVAHVPAGMMHTYGYLFSQLKTVYGLKGKRWLESRLDERLGLPAGIFSPWTPRGEFTSNVTSVLFRLIGAPQKLSRAARLMPTAKAVGRVEQSVTWKTPGGGEVSATVVTHLIELKPLKGFETTDTHLLVYEVIRGGRRRLVTAFPINRGFAGTIMATKSSRSAVFSPRFNLYVDPTWTVISAETAGFARD